MARRRLQTILATTVLAAGLSAAPASAQTLSDLTDGVEETTEKVEDTVDKTTDTVDDTVEKTTKAVEETTEAVEDATTGSTGSDDSNDESEDSGDTSTSDDSGGDLGSTVEDTTKAVTDTVDDTVEKTTKVVEDTTEAVTDAVGSASPDDPNSDAGGGDGDGGDVEGEQTGTQPIQGPDNRGFIPGNGVVAAGSDGSRTAQDPNATSSGGSLAEALAAFGALGRSGSSNTTLTGQGTTSSTDLPAPQVADPDTEPFDEFAGSSDVEKPAVMASGPADPTDSSAALLKVFAALLVLGTGVTAKRAVEQA